MPSTMYTPCKGKYKNELGNVGIECICIFLRRFRYILFERKYFIVVDLDKVFRWGDRTINTIRGMFFNSCHLLDYFSLRLTTKMLFICGESPIFSDQIRIKIVAV